MNIAGPFFAKKQVKLCTWGELYIIFICFATIVYTRILDKSVSYKGNFVRKGKHFQAYTWLRMKPICLKYPYIN